MFQVGIALLQASEEELLGLPPPTVSNLGSPEDHESYFESLLKAEGYFENQSCEYNQYLAGFALWSLPPPKPNSVDSVLGVAEEEDGGGKSWGKKDEHSETAEARTFER